MRGKKWCPRFQFESEQTCTRDSTKSPVLLFSPLSLDDKMVFIIHFIQWLYPNIIIYSSYMETTSNVNPLLAMLYQFKPKKLTISY